MKASEPSGAAEKAKKSKDSKADASEAREGCCPAPRRTSPCRRRSPGPSRARGRCRRRGRRRRTASRSAAAPRGVRWRAGSRRPVTEPARIFTPSRALDGLGAVGEAVDGGGLDGRPQGVSADLPGPSPVAIHHEDARLALAVGLGLGAVHAVQAGGPLLYKVVEEAEDAVPSSWPLARAASTGRGGVVGDAVEGRPLADLVPTRVEGADDVQGQLPAIEGPGRDAGAEHPVAKSFRPKVGSWAPS